MRFLWIIPALFLLAACSGQDQNNSLKDPWIGGTDGVLISFEENAPQPEVFDGGDYPFGVVVKLKNEGEYDVPKENVKVTISGILASEFGKTEASLIKRPDENILPKRKDAEGRVEDSDPVFVDFGDFTFNSSLVAQQPYTFRAEACYTYQTTANSVVCILEDNLDEAGLCKVSEQKQIFNSGAPLQIINFIESSRGKDKIAFTFTIQHKGNGRIYQQLSGCNSTTRNFEDIVWVEVDTGISGAIECSGLREGTSSSGYVRLFSDNKPITCAQTVNTNSDYQKPVVIRMKYDYQDNKETTVLVKHIPK